MSCGTNEICFMMDEEEDDDNFHLLEIYKEKKVDDDFDDIHPDFLLLGVVSLLGRASGGRVLSSLKASTWTHIEEDVCVLGVPMLHVPMLDVCLAF